MASNLLVPFNFAPSSVAVKTASYTIPAGKYARASVSLLGAATFTIGGVTALESTSNSVLASDNIGHAANVGLYAGSAHASNSASGTAFNEATDSKVIVHDFWLPTGTIINGTGTWRAVVQEFNEIT